MPGVRIEPATALRVRDCRCTLENYYGAAQWITGITGIIGSDGVSMVRAQLEIQSVTCRSVATYQPNDLGDGRQTRSPILGIGTEQPGKNEAPFL